MQVYFRLIVLFFVGLDANPLLRVYENPLNNKMVDLFLVVDEASARMSQLQLGQIKIVLNEITNELQPSGSSPYFGVFFYGATTTVQAVVPFPTTLASSVKSNLDLKQYVTTQLNPSTLSAALDSVISACAASSRTGVSRVTVIFSSNPDVLAASRVRQLESSYDMTVIVVGIGSLASITSLQSLSSHPSHINAISFSTFAEVISSAPYISWVITNAPPFRKMGITFTVPSTTTGVYYTVQLQTTGYTFTNNTVITYTTNCASCSIYASLSEPNPTSVSVLPNAYYQNVHASGYVSRVFYFRVPQNTNHLFMSFVGTGMSSLTGVFNIFNLPPMMTVTT